MIVASSPRIDWTVLIFSFGGAKTKTKTTALHHAAPLSNARSPAVRPRSSWRFERRGLWDNKRVDLKYLKWIQIHQNIEIKWNKFKQVEIETFHPKPQFYHFLRTVVAPFHPFPTAAFELSKARLSGAKPDEAVWVCGAPNRTIVVQISSCIPWFLVYSDTWGMTATTLINYY